jgi:short-subunit dehydrogenase
MSSLPSTRPQILITGASSGIGRATAVTLGPHCDGMILVSRSIEKLRETATQSHCATKVVGLDLSDPLQRPPLMSMLSGSVPPITCVVHCAGSGLPRTIDELTIEEMRGLQELHVYSLIEIVQAVLPGMKAAGYGRIISIGSLAPHRPRSFMTAYAASKASMRTAMQCIADEVVTSGITVNIISPGSVDTELGNAGRNVLAQLSGKSAEHLNAERIGHLPSGLISPRAIAEVVQFLLSPSNQALSGQDIIIAGTLVMR